MSHELNPNIWLFLFADNRCAAGGDVVAVANAAAAVFRRQWANNPGFPISKRGLRTAIK